MLSEPDSVRLRHMLDAATEVVDFAIGRTRNDLENDPMFSRAVVRDIEIIGEAAEKSVQRLESVIRVFPGQIL